VIARVQPLTRTRAVAGSFDYLLPSELEGVRVGSLLEVTFSRRRAVGVVVGLADRSELPLERLSRPEGVLPVSLPEDLVALAGWLATEYCSTTARALSLLLPPGAAAGGGASSRLVAELTDAGRAALAGREARLTARQRETLVLLAGSAPIPASELGHEHARRLEARGLLALSTRTRQSKARWDGRNGGGEGAGRAGGPPLTVEQEAALEPILRALGDGTAGRGIAREFLLHGVTGSGKTEVYLRAVAAALAAGRGAIVLVPEIALTPQSVARFRARFGDVVAVLHSALADGERRDEWLRLRTGEARVCVGPRSAVFAPVGDIGLIVVDEEHEGAYKHEGDPRYDARAVAARRARDHRAILVAGTATPRPESFATMTRLALTRRVDGCELPPVRVLDMRGRHHPLHPETRLALADLRAAGGKAILLLNRRGWSNFLSCRTCGTVWMCPQCDVALVLHLSAGTVACHHCGHRERVPERCRACGSGSVARHGAGTERIEHDLREALGDGGFPIFRLDAESSRRRDQAEATLTRFGAAPAGVLVGTQVVAKGHDFPDVTLGVVLDADQTLRFPDFRAEERTFSLVTQLAGRAGRGEKGGEVLVQTVAPDARSIAFAARHDADGFLADELRRRRALSYPPYSSLIRIVCSSVDATSSLRACTVLRERISPPEATVLGPAPLFRLRGRHRSQLVIKARDRAAAILAAGAAVNRLARGRELRNVNVSVDVDPQ
jgi:primosomal protein N' (replication factor Y)